MAPLPKSVHVTGRNRRLRGQGGFTLIDLLFVIAIIGLLSVLALPGILRARGAAQASSALGTMRAINSGAEFDEVVARFLDWRLAHDEEVRRGRHASPVELVGAA